MLIRPLILGPKGVRIRGIPLYIKGALIHKRVYKIQGWVDLGSYCTVGNFHWYKILQNCMLTFQKKFRGFKFRAFSNSRSHPHQPNVLVQYSYSTCTSHFLRPFKFSRHPIYLEKKHEILHHAKISRYTVLNS